MDRASTTALKSPAAGSLPVGSPVPFTIKSLEVQERPCEDPSDVKRKTDSSKDQFAQGAAKRTGKLRSEMRKRVCAGCVEPTDLVLGSVHSEGECQRCGRSPCGYGAVVSPRVS